MSYGDYRQPDADHVPLVGRPRGAAWRTLQADGVVWEGQAVLVGGDTDLATRMIVTHRRVVFARGGGIVLDLAREWLRPAPVLHRDGSIQLSITAPGAGYGEQPETITLRMRDGHPAAGQVIAMLAGSGARRIVPEAISGGDYVRGLLPPLPDARRLIARGNQVRLTDPEPAASDLPLIPSRLDDELPFGSLEFQPRQALPPLPAAMSRSMSSQAPPERDRDPVVRPAPPPLAMTRDRAWNLEPAHQSIHQLLPRGTRRRRGWIFRLGGLVVLLGFSALLGADRIPLPGGIRQVPTAPTVVATATVRPVAQFIQPTTAAGIPSTVTAGSTAFALSLGSQGQPPPTPSGEAAAQAATEPPATAAPAATEPATVVPTSEQPAVAATPSTPAPAAASPAAATGPLVETVDQARRGATLPEYGLTAPDAGEWVVVSLSITNQGEAEAELTMTDYVLVADGAELTVDTRSTVVASILRLEDAPDAIDSAISLDPGESVTLPLVYTVPAEATDLALRSGETVIEIVPE